MPFVCTKSMGWSAIAGELYLRMETVVDVDATLYYWLQRPDSVTHKMRSASFYHDHIVAAKKNFILCQENSVIPARSYYTLTGNLKDEGKLRRVLLKSNSLELTNCKFQI